MPNNPAAAFWFIALERCCQQQLMIDATGVPPKLVPPDKARYSREHVGSEYIGFSTVTIDAGAASKGSSLDHFAFTIDDYEDIERRLQAAGVSYEPAVSPNGGIRQMFITELNGVNIELNWRPPAAR